MERALADDYAASVEALLPTLRDTAAVSTAAKLANLPQIVCGYETVKLRNVRSYLAALTEHGGSAPRTERLLARLRKPRGHVER